MSYLSTKNYLIEVSMGNISNASVIHKYGRNSDMPNGVEKSITSDGNINLPRDSTRVRIKSGGNVNDTLTGSGARKIIIVGSNMNGEYIEEELVTNGSSSSALSNNEFLRIYRSYVTECGTYITDGLSTDGSNQGDIIIENSGGTMNIITISQYEGQSQYGAYHIPINKTGYLLSVTSTISGTKESDIVMYTRENATNSISPSPKRLRLYLDGVIGESVFIPESPMVIGSDCDIWFTGISSAAGTEVSIDFELLLVDL